MWLDDFGEPSVSTLWKWNRIPNENPYPYEKIREYVSVWEPCL